MNGSLLTTSRHSRVHILDDAGKPLCGAAARTRGDWSGTADYTIQVDLGEANCKRCLKSQEKKCASPQPAS